MGLKEIWKDFIRSQYKKLYETIELVEPDKLGEMNSIEVRSLLLPYCKEIYLSDRIYGLANTTQSKKFSIQTRVEMEKWLKEQHDCDEFSFALMGYWNEGLKQFAFGIAWSSSHAFNIMIDDKKQVWIVEPQNNNFTKIEDTKNNSLYSPLRVIII